MNLESKDAIQNLILLVVFVMCGLMFFMFIIYAGLSFNMGVDKSIESIKDGHTLSNLFKKDGLLTVQILSQICCMIIPAFFIIKFKSSANKMITNSNFKWNFLWLGIGLLIVSLPFINLLAFLNEKIPLNEWMNSKETEINEMIKQILDMHSIKDFVICLIAIAIIPAISEELIFRGILQNQLIRLFQNKWLGLIVGALIFSAIH
ncbi:MAG: CPBP family intramembrane glutamic endopeptidase, partial [Saprospiraceae bacterium]